RVSMRAEIAKIHRRIGATTIYVTHDQTEAMTLADRIVIMSATKNPAGTGTIGRVEQIGTPQEVYNNPVNKFVAGFIGSPAMNFFEVTLEDGRLVGPNRDFSLQVPEGNLKRLREKGYEGNKLIFGIRPEDINMEPAFLETFPESVLTAKISVSELLGAESHLYCTVGGSEFVAKVDARDHMNTGSSIKLGFDLNKAHYFDAETEDNIF
ncbi:ABC transporter ATP-binding protein, partial [Streptococcus sanguinis]